MKKISIILASAMFVVAGLGFGYFQKKEIKNYQPRISKLAIVEEEAEEEEAKGMFEFFKMFRNNPTTGTVSLEDIKLAQQGLRNMSNLRGSLPLNWSELGPDNVGGRTRCILIDNQDATGNTVYAGGVSGGLWKSTNGGAYWNKISDIQENLIVSSICQTPDGTLFYGTGEDGFYFSSGQGQGGGFFGGGAFKSSDGGKTFKLLSNTNPSASGGTKWLSVQSMAAHPTKNRAYACLANGFYLTDDGGTTWTKPSTSGAPGNATIQEVKVDKNGVVYVTNSTNVWRSDDGGDNYVNITPKNTNTTGGAFSNSRRISIAVGYSNTNYVYIMVADNASKLAGIFQSTDKGSNWSRIASRSQNGVDFDPLASTASAQGVYDNVIGVDPTNENRVFAAGVDWWEWLNPAVYPNNPKSGWTNPTSQFGSKFNNLYIHSDVHFIAFDSKHGSPFITYIGTDGGITKSVDGCNTFATLNRGYNVTQFYGMAVNPLSSSRGWEKKYFGGTQDNSCVLITGKGNTAQTSVTISGGDGFQCEGSQIYPEIMFYGSQNGGYMRSGNGGVDAQRMYDCRTIWQMDNAYGYGSANKCEDKTSGFIDYFNVPMRLKEKWSDTTSLMAICANRQNKTGGAIYITRDAIDLKKQTGALWFNLYENNGYFHKIEISNDLKSIYAATGSSLIRIQGFDTITFPTDTKDSSWKVDQNSIQVKTLNNFGGRFITGIAEDKNDPAHLVVSLGNYGSTDHVYESKDSGTTWVNISGNNMLNFPVYDVIISNENSKVIVVATEFGIFATKDGGLTWTEQNNGMARVPVLQIRQYQDKPWEGPTLYIATHGRGLFKSNSLTTGIEVNNTSSIKTRLSVFPNPTSDVVNIEYSAKQTGTAYITVVDIKGNLIYNADYRIALPGNQRISLNTANWSSGNYVIYLKTKDGEQYQKLSVIK